ncbi:DUF2087 domain-containing protein [Xanthobacter sp. KR7-225]|uniref:DUF2087 domain-containing protein n=1 Tax=Xanthobacter sp. KR7-225 TaxID=3156613 RepID=UPI0032B520A3
MSRSVIPFVAEDVSALARTLGREIGAAGEKPSHVELLNILARAVGFKNFQHFRAQQAARAHLHAAEQPAPVPAPVDLTRVARTARHFDPAGRLARWPSKASQRDLVLWALWSRLPRGATLTEKEVNGLLAIEHGFGDPLLLRRFLVDAGLLWRTRDGRAYRRVEQAPSAEGLALIRHLGRRSAH